MINFSQLLSEKKNAVLEHWLKAVKQDREISSDENLSITAVKNHVPRVLDAMVTILSRSADNDLQTLVEASLEHGTLRAEQGFSAVEISREYRLLRRTILAALEPAMLQSSVTEVFRVFHIVDAVVDEAIAQCFKSYVDERLRELEQIQQQLTLTNQELTRLVHANQDNLSHLAHEFKTPLNSIIGYSELLLRQQQRFEFGDNLPSMDGIERVLRNGRQLLRLVNDILEISRYDSGKMHLNLVQTDVQTIVNTVVETIEPMAIEQGLKLTVDCNNAPAQILNDPFRLQQILTNLLSNAVRYTKTGSIAIVCQTAADQGWHLTVQDTGVGIAPEDQPHIFDPYYRVKSSNQTQTIDGTGLGLAIVARLVNLMQGKIEVFSQIGMGTTFVVTLPIEVKIAESAIANPPNSVFSK
jgi:signal transduction histidine kinase